MIITKTAKARLAEIEQIKQEYLAKLEQEESQLRLQVLAEKTEAATSYAREVYQTLQESEITVVAFIKALNGLVKPEVPSIEERAKSVHYRSPDGREVSLKGPVPEWVKELIGITDGKECNQYIVKHWPRVR